jgi:asparagine synthase (glutamine-hydrolysing)
LKALEKTLKIPPGRLIWSICIAPLAPAWFARIYRKQRKHTAYDYAITHFNLDFAQRIDLKKRLDVEDLIPKTSQDDMLLSLDDGFLQYLMEAADHIAGAFSVQYGHPFFDKRLVEFCLALPSDQRLRLGYSRWIMRQALKGILPEMVRMRGDKADLSSNFDQRLLSVDGDILGTLASCDDHKVWEYASFDEFAKTYERISSCRQKAETVTLWAAANLALWLNRFEVLGEEDDRKNNMR